MDAAGERARGASNKIAAPLLGVLVFACETLCTKARFGGTGEGEAEGKGGCSRRPGPTQADGRRRNGRSARSCRCFYSAGAFNCASPPSRWTGARSTTTCKQRKKTSLPLCVCRPNSATCWSFRGGRFVCKLIAIFEVDGGVKVYRFD